MYEFKGTLSVKRETVKISDKFQKRELVVTDNATQYPQMVLFELTQDKCSILDDYNEGDEIQVTFNVRGREWKSPSGEMKYFNSLNAWKLDKLSGELTQTPQTMSEEPPVSQFEPDNSNKDDNDLPF